MTEIAAESTSGKWIRPTRNTLPYASVERQAVPAEPSATSQDAATVAEASATPPNIPAPESGPASKKTVTRKPGRPVIRIDGEPFHVEHEGDVYYLVHDQWSLLGSGPSLAAAYKNLLFEASEVAPVYIDTPASELTYEGSRLAKFLLRFR